MKKNLNHNPSDDGQISHTRKKIKNLLAVGLKIKNSSEGYTLVELLAVMVVMVAVGIIVAAILVSSLRGTNKTDVINNIRQSGSYPITQMSKMIEFAKEFKGVSVDGISYITDCTLLPPSPPPAVTPVPIQYKYIKITTFDDSDIIFSCQGNPPTVASNGASLVDENQVKVDSCWFNCSQNYVTQPPIIGIHFTLTKNASSNFSEQTVSIPFETSVTMRNTNN